MSKCKLGLDEEFKRQDEEAEAKQRCIDSDFAAVLKQLG